MTDRDDLHTASSSGHFTYARHNETDFDAFKRFQDSMDERYAKVERERIIHERRLNLQRWDNNLPKRWQKASLSRINHPAAYEILELINTYGQQSFFIHGATELGKYLAYAIVRKFIGAGWTTFSQVKIISEEAMLSLAYTGFEGRAKFENLLSDKTKVFILDNVGARDFYDERRELPLLERFIDHIYSNSLTAIFTGNDKPESFGAVLNDSGNAKLMELIGKTSVELQGQSISASKQSVSKLSEELINEHFAD